MKIFFTKMTKFWRIKIIYLHTLYPETEILITLNKIYEYLEIEYYDFNWLYVFNFNSSS